jgi:hypothetical protein
VLASKAQAVFGVPLYVERTTLRPPINASISPMHYEGRAADMRLSVTTALTQMQYDQLAALATSSGFDYVSKEDGLLHATVQQECTANFDLILVLDLSTNATKANWDTYGVPFVHQLVAQFDIGPTKVQVGILTFGTNVTVIANLNTYQNKSSLLTRIDALAYDTGTQRTYTSLALTTVAAQMLLGSSGMRTNVGQTLIVVTDGQSTTGFAPGPAAADLRARGVTIFSVGVAGYTLSELQDMATQPWDTHVYALSTFDSLATIVDAIQGSACRSADVFNSGVDVVEQGVVSCGWLYLRPQCTNQTNVKIVLTVLNGSVDFYASTKTENPGPNNYEYVDNSTTTTRVILVQKSDTGIAYIGIKGTAASASMFEIAAFASIFPALDGAATAIAVPESTPTTRSFSPHPSPYLRATQTTTRGA